MTALPTPNDPGGSLDLPPCPLTAQPAKRRIQGVPKNLLRSLWRVGVGVDVARLLEGVPGIGLYESECGLVFFHPPIEGDARFYREFYERVSMHERLASHLLARAEYRRAARHIPPGARVLDLGCGVGAFRAHLPHAHFTGLDPFAPEEADSAVLRETAQEHASRHPASYDVVTAFQLIEHLAEPLRLVENMLRLLRPGGLLILCVPLHPSAMTALPNFLLNALPHHLTWWNQSALFALASHFSLTIEDLSELDPSPHEGLIHWMAKLCPVQTGSKDNAVYFTHRWSWHLGLAAAYAAARLAHRFIPLPRSSRPAAVFLAARKPD